MFSVLIVSRTFHDRSGTMVEKPGGAMRTVACFASVLVTGCVVQVSELQAPLELTSWNVVTVTYECEPGFTCAM